MHCHCLRMRVRVFLVGLLCFINVVGIVMHSGDRFLRSLGLWIRLSFEFWNIKCSLHSQFITMFLACRVRDIVIRLEFDIS